eukprot:284818885_4
MKIFWRQHPFRLYGKMHRKQVLIYPTCMIGRYPKTPLFVALHHILKRQRSARLKGRWKQPLKRRRSRVSDSHTHISASFCGSVGQPVPPNKRPPFNMQLETEAVPILTPAELRHIKRRHRANEIESHIKVLHPLNRGAVICFILALLALAAFIYTCVENSAIPFMSLGANETDYGIVIDAGSHGSRLHLYSWPS